jgi:exonuclease III
MNSTPSPYLKICHFNIRSLSDKLDELKHFLVTHSIGICMLNETFLHPRKTIKIHNYNIVRRDRDSRGGGVCVLIHRSLFYEEIKIPSRPVTELLVIKVPNVVGGQALTLMSYYNPPGSQIDMPALNNLFSQHQRVLLMGDLNGHNPIWLGSHKDNAGEAIVLHPTNVQFIFISINIL